MLVKDRRVNTGKMPDAMADFSRSSEKQRLGKTPENREAAGSLHVQEGYSNVRKTFWRCDEARAKGGSVVRRRACRSQSRNFDAASGYSVAD